MRKITNKNKIAALAASAALVAVSGGAAFAYWSTTGSGAGSATASSGTQAVRINISVEPDVAPGSPKTITYTADNSRNTSSSPVTLSNAQATATDKEGCLPAWFTATVPAGTTLVSGGATAAALGTGTLTLSDLADTDQSACKGASVTLTVGSN